MENLLDLLIILFVIYAFLVPIFKKRTPPSQEQPIPYEPENSNKQQSEESSQKILREIEELFGYRSEKSEETLKSGNEETKVFESETITFQKHPEVKFEEKFLQSKSNRILEEKINKDFAIEVYDYNATIQDTDIVEYDYSKSENYNLETEENFQEEKYFEFELTAIDDFKKAIIYKEIFDTPIALRMRRIKWQRNMY